MNEPRHGIALIGRIALALIFIVAGFQKLMGFGGTVEYIARQGVPLPQVAAGIAVAIELGGGLAVLAGWMTRLAALALIVFLIVITPIFHNFWAMAGEMRMINQIMFMKNLSIAGGFLILLAFGPGRYSVDKS